MEEVERLLREARGLEEMFDGDRAWFNAFHFRYNGCKVDYASHMACNEHPHFDSEKNGKIRGWGKRFATCAILEVWDQAPGPTIGALRSLGGLLSGAIKLPVQAVGAVLGTIKNVVRFRFIDALDDAANAAKVGAEPVAVVVLGIAKVVSDVFEEADNKRMMMCDLCAASMIYALENKMLQNDDYPNPNDSTAPQLSRPHARFLDEALRFNGLKDYEVNQNGEPYGNICGMTETMLDHFREHNPHAMLELVQAIFEQTMRTKVYERLEAAWKRPVSTLVQIAPEIVGGDTWEEYLARMDKSSAAGSQEAAKSANGVKEAFITALRENTAPKERWTETDKGDVSNYYFKTGTDADIHFFSWRQCGKTLPAFNELRELTPTVDEIKAGIMTTGQAVGDIVVGGYDMLTGALATGWSKFTGLLSSDCDCGGQCPGGMCPKK